jgi:hypothetical protein
VTVDPQWMPAEVGGLLLVSFQIAPDVQPDFNRWYNREHIPARMGLGAGGHGFQGCTRYLTTGPEPRFVNAYPLGSHRFLQSDEYLAVRDAEARMPIVQRLSGAMKSSRPDLFTRRVLKTWVRTGESAEGEAADG